MNVCLLAGNGSLRPFRDRFPSSPSLSVHDNLLYEYNLADADTEDPLWRDEFKIYPLLLSRLLTCPTPLHQKINHH